MARLVITYRILSTISMAVLALSACKKAKDKPEGAPAPVAGDDKGTPAAASAKGSCPAGFTNPNDLGVCIKLIDGLTQNDASVGHAGNEKAAGWTADGSTSVHIIVGDYTEMFWKQAVDGLVAGGGFGGTLVDKATVGADGVTANFTADPGTRERKIRITKIHNDKVTAECWAEKQSMSTVGPKLDDVLAICSNVTFAN
jgi:hypothetical protein